MNDQELCDLLDASGLPWGAHAAARLRELKLALDIKAKLDQVAPPPPWGGLGDVTTLDEDLSHERTDEQPHPTLVPEKPTRKVRRS